MKKIASLIFIFCLSIQWIFSQDVYYYNDYTKETINTETYEKRKNNRITSYEKSHGKVHLEENLEQIKFNKDSIVYQYQWSFLLGKRVNKILKYQKKLKSLKGNEFPIGKLVSMNGTKMKLDMLQGKPTLINFWTTQCPPCIAEMPTLNALKEKYKDKVNFISIVPDDASKVSEFLDKKPFNFEHCIVKEKYTNKLGIKGVPVNIFLDKDCIVHTIDGSITDDGTRFSNMIEELF